MKKRYDYYAAAALQALIAKTPLIDSKSELGTKASEDEMQEMKKEIARTAHAYAAWMMKTRKEFTDYLKGIPVPVREEEKS